MAKTKKAETKETKTADATAETKKPTSKKAKADAKSDVPVIKAENKYEAMFLLGAAATTDVEKSTTLVRGLVERHGGKVLVLKKWDERKLSYEIKGQKRGLYVISYFTAVGSSIAPMEREVLLSEDFLRVLITDANHLNQTEMEAVEPQPIAPREERAPWDRPFEGSPRDSRPGGSGGGGGGGGGGFDRGPRPPREAAPAGAAAGSDKE